MPKMATLECSSGQDGFSPKENGDALPEEKPLNIDYSEDLWLANGEDSSGPYAQQPSKVLPQDSACAYSCQTEVHNGYPNTFAAHSSVDSRSQDGVKSQYPGSQEGNAQGDLWSGVLSERDTTTLQPAAHYMNGLVEQNGMEYNSGDERDFAQLVPAGSYLDNGTAGHENPDKTFTSLMPAAAVGLKDEVHEEYTSMESTHQQQMVYYGSGNDMKSDPTSPMVDENNITMSYSQQVQMAAGNNDGSEVQENGSNAVYISMNALNGDGQTASPAGNLTVLSPAMIRMSGTSGEDQSNRYQHISTLPFVHNGGYSTQTSFTSYQSSTTPTIVSGGDNQQALHQSDYSSDHTSFSSTDGTALTVCTTLTPSLQTSAVDYQEDDDEDDDQDDDTNQDIEEDSVEFSEFGCPACNEAFVDQAALDEHMNNHPPLKTFVCETCSKGFATRRYLKYHRKNHCKRAGSYEGWSELEENDPNGEIKRFSCNVCSRPFRVLKCMKVHKKKKHGILKDFTCHICADTFSSSQELVDHPCAPKGAVSAPQVIEYTPPPLAVPVQKRKKKLKNAKPCCNICGKTFSDRISVDIHRVKHIEEELYPCDMCSEDEDSNGSHLAVHFRIRFFTDDNQHILEDQRAAVVSHDQSRSDDGSSVSATPIHNPDSATPQSAPATPVYLPATPTHPPGTPACAVNTISASDYSREAQEHQAGVNHLLDQSGFAQKYAEFAGSQSEEGVLIFSVSNFEGNHNERQPTSDSSLLASHQDGAEQQKSHVYNAQFTDGEVIHDASGSVLAVTPRKKKFKTSKLHMCDICNKSFGDTSKLELHYKSNHLHDRPYQCDVCEKSFFTKWKLQRHMLSHLEQKPHSCPMCSKSFVERGKLEAHYRTHLGTKPYKCDQCPKTFTVKSQLSIHQRRIHSTDQPFGCLVCGKAFLWKSGLDKHMRKHTREKPYICESCGIKYSNKANLIVHMSKAHNQTYVDKQSP